MATVSTLDTQFQRKESVFTKKNRFAVHLQLFVASLQVPLQQMFGEFNSCFDVSYCSRRGYALQKIET